VTASGNARPSQFAATSKAEASKHRPGKHDDAPVVTPNPRVASVPIAFSDPDFGGVGFPVRFYTAVVKPGPAYFDALRRPEPEKGE
jgi:hypothetical protein